MKKYLTVLALFFSNTTFAQSINERLQSAANLLLSQYNCDCPTNSTGCVKQCLQPAVLDSNLNLVFANVALSSSDLIKTGTAGSITQDRDKGTLSANISTLLDGDIWTAANFGINANSTKGVFNVFNANGDGWNKDIGFSTGLTLHLFGGQAYDISACDRLLIERKVYLAQQKVGLACKDLRDLDSSRIANEIGKVELTLREYQDYAAGVFTDCDESDRLAKNLVQIDSAKAKLVYLHYLEKYAKKGGEADIIREILQGFDLKHRTTLNGYSIHWLDVKINANANTLSLAGKKLSESDSATLGDAKSLKLDITGSYNYSKMRKTILIFAQANIGYRMASILDLVSLAGNPYVSRPDPNQPLQIINPDNGSVLMRYNERTNTLGIGSLGSYLALFFGKQKSVGFDVRVNLRLALPGITAYPSELQDFRYQWTLMAGPVIRLPGESDQSKATLGVKAGFTSVPNWNSAPRDRFGVRLEVGIPFKYYNK